MKADRRRKTKDEGRMKLTITGGDLEDSKHIFGESILGNVWTMRIMWTVGTMGSLDGLMFGRE